MFNLQKYKDNSEFSIIDWEFAELIADLSTAKNGSEDYEKLMLLSAMALNSVRKEHSCLDLQAWYDREAIKQDEPDEDSPLKSPLSPDEWFALLKKYPEISSADSADNKPLLPIEELSLLFLHKYRKYEKTIENFINENLAQETIQKLSQSSISSAHDFFKANDFDDDLQQQAIDLALKSHFAIITGGPGTGKTTVLATILALELQRNNALRISLAAPTGKAAARMTEAISEDIAQKRLKVSHEALEALGKLKAKTIHSLIGARDTGLKPTYNPENPLSCDLLVIDEASMISLSLMAKLLEALPTGCRLLLIGDKDQLASVEAGSVLADLCQNAKLQASIAYLKKNYRSQENPELCDFIGEIAMGNKADLSKLYKETKPAEINFYAEKLPQINRGTTSIDAQLITALKNALADLLGEDFLDTWSKVDDLDKAFEYIDKFKVLCATHDGHFGVKNLNRLMATILDKPLYSKGAPVLVLKNDYVNDLRNGDIGICWEDMVYFPALADEQQEDKKYRSFKRMQLPEHELVYAMTIHKSQGSGYDNVLMTLPEKDNPVLSKELVYTGITRTRKKFQLWANKEITEKALQRPTERWSALFKL